MHFRWWTKSDEMREKQQQEMCNFNASVFDNDGEDNDDDDINNKKLHLQNMRNEHFPFSVFLILLGLRFVSNFVVPGSHSSSHFLSSEVMLLNRFSEQTHCTLRQIHKIVSANKVLTPGFAFFPAFRFYYCNLCCTAHRWLR